MGAHVRICARARSGAARPSARASCERCAAGCGARCGAGRGGETDLREPRRELRSLPSQLILRPVRAVLGGLAIAHGAI